jgi:hypothetical protein
MRTFAMLLAVAAIFPTGAVAQQDQPFCLQASDGMLTCHFETMAQCQDALKKGPVRTGTCVPIRSRSPSFTSAPHAPRGGRPALPTMSSYLVPMWGRRVIGGHERSQAPAARQMRDPTTGRRARAACYFRCNACAVATTTLIVRFVPMPKVEHLAQHPRQRVGDSEANEASH